jgi:hypothetical protein
MMHGLINLILFHILVPLKHAKATRNKQKINGSTNWENPSRPKFLGQETGHVPGTEGVQKPYSHPLFSNHPVKKESETLYVPSTSPGFQQNVY